MIKFKCKTCEGEYESPQKDGLDYYHACAPVTDKDGNTTERQDKRDENAGVKLEGLGITILE